jgi:hypothetical protein
MRLPLDKRQMRLAVSAHFRRYDIPRAYRGGERSGDPLLGVGELANDEEFTDALDLLFNRYNIRPVTDQGAVMTTDPLSSYNDIVAYMLRNQEYEQVSIDGEVEVFMDDTGAFSAIQEETGR